MQVSIPELKDRQPIELTPSEALAQLSPFLIRKRGYQFPTFSDVVEKPDDRRIQPSLVVLDLANPILRHADGVRPTIRCIGRCWRGSVFI